MRRLAILLLLIAGVAPAAQKLAGGPFVVNVTRNTATVVWIVEEDALVLHSPTGAAKTSPALRVEKTTLTGLQPNTKYDYDVPGQEGVKGSFRTPPAGATPFHFVVYGDNRTRNDVHRRVVATLLKSGIPDFVLQTGDMVENGFDTSLWPTFFDIEHDLLRQTVIFPALGNHERDCKNFFDFFQLSKAYYSFNWGNAHFSVLNSDLAGASPLKNERDEFWAEETKWLEDDLANSQNSEFRFLMAHHAPFSAVKGRQDDNPHMRALIPMLEKYKLTAAFFGHDHNYQHYLKNGIPYLVSGGGGAPLYDVDNPNKEILQKAISVENFISVGVDGKIVKIQVTDIDGKKIDELEIRH